MGSWSPPKAVPEKEKWLGRPRVLEVAVVGTKILGRIPKLTPQPGILRLNRSPTNLKLLSSFAEFATPAHRGYQRPVQIVMDKARKCPPTLQPDQSGPMLHISGVYGSHPQAKPWALMNSSLDSFIPRLDRVPPIPWTKAQTRP